MGGGYQTTFTVKFCVKCRSLKTERKSVPKRTESKPYSLNSMLHSKFILIIISRDQKATLYIWFVGIMSFSGSGSIPMNTLVISIPAWYDDSVFVLRSDFHKRLLSLIIHIYLSIISSVFKKRYTTRTCIILWSNPIWVRSSVSF